MSAIAAPLARGTRILDYLSFTVLDCTVLEDVLLRLGLPMVGLEYGRYRYKRSFVSETPGVSVYYDGTADGMGIHVQISGQGLRWLESMPSFVCWIEWLKEWSDLAPKFTRIDIALDELSGRVGFDHVLAHMESGSIATRAQSYQVTRGYGRKTGATLYLGSRSSEAMMRCYDKGAERGGSSYLRFEFEFKGERADMVARLLMSSGWDAVVGHCRSVCEFKELGQKDKCITRQRAASWWEELVSASKVVLNKAAVAVESVARLYGWLKKQVSQSLAVLIEIDGGAIDSLYELAIEGRDKWRDKHKRLAKIPVPLSQCCVSC